MSIFTLLLEQQAAQVRGRAQAGVGQVDLALVGVEPLDQFGVVVGRQGLRPISVIGTSLTMPRYSKSFSVSYGSLRYSAGEVDMPMWCSSRVWPSGAALATLAAPSVPPAPPTFSTTTVAPPRGLRSTLSVAAEVARDLVGGAAGREGARRW
jgi:hypothetical protein